MIGLRGLDGWISYWLWERQEGGIPVKSNPSGTRPGHIMTDGVSSGFLNRSLKPLYKTPVSYPLEISDLQELWDDLCEDYLPLRVQVYKMAAYCLSD